jgi:hypothetical protein
MAIYGIISTNTFLHHKQLFIWILSHILLQYAHFCMLNNYLLHVLRDDFCIGLVINPRVAVLA